MADFADVHLDKPHIGEPSPGPRRRGWALLLLLPLLGAVGYLIWSVTRSGDENPGRVRVATEQQVARGDGPAAGVPGEAIDLPPLGDTDALVRRLAGALSAHPRAAAWLASDQLLRNFTLVVVNIADGRSPARQLPMLRPTGEFIADEDGDGAHLNHRSYRRYDEYADAVAALNAVDVARLYATLKPRIQEAYAELGHPDEDFDRALERAFTQLLQTPVIEGDVPLVPRSVSWDYADPRLQSLNGAQRQFLRMGPRNVRLLQDKLRELAGHLGIRPAA